jgi:hypothetical protein
VSLLEENTRVLAERHPEAAVVLAGRTSDPSGLAVTPTPSGSPTAKLDGIYLHGRHDPRRDALVQVRQEIDPACTAIVAMGFGLGYGPEAARQAFPSVPLLVVEPDAALFHDALAARDLRVLLSDPDVHLHVGGSPEGLPIVLESLPLARPAFLRLRPALRTRRSTYRASEETIRSWLLRRDINVNTLHRFGRLWVRNLCRNMGEFLRCPGVAPLSGLFEGIPALVVAGGPSLDSVAGQLDDLRQRMLIVSVNTSLPACRRRGVEPDFTVVVDPQFWASRSLDWFPAHRGVVVAEPSTCPRVFRRQDQRFFLCSSLFPLGESLEEAVGEKGQLGAGGSVSTSAWDLARLLGARPLYAAGLDLGFPGMRAHCRGTYPEALWLAAADRLKPLEGSAFTAVRDIGLFPARSSDGGTTPTDRRMLLYKWWFENQLRIHPDIECRTLSPRSVAIEGMPLASMEEALRLPVVRPAIDERMQQVRRTHTVNAGGPAAKARLLDTLRDLGRQLSELERLSAQGRTRSQDLGRALAAGDDPRDCLADMDRIDEAIMALSARTIAGFLIQTIIHGLLGEGERTPDPQEVVSRSGSVYAGIEDSAAWQRGLIERALLDLEAFTGSPG